MNSLSEEYETNTEEIAETKEDCIIIPRHMKPLIDCCKDFDEGKIDSSDFFAQALIKTGEFMKSVKERSIEPTD